MDGLGDLNAALAQSQLILVPGPHIHIQRSTCHLESNSNGHVIIVPRGSLMASGYISYVVGKNMYCLLRFGCSCSSCKRSSLNPSAGFHDALGSNTTSPTGRYTRIPHVKCQYDTEAIQEYSLLTN